jgi:hypothetical protein
MELRHSDAGEGHTQHVVLTSNGKLARSKGSVKISMV